MTRATDGEAVLRRYVDAVSAGDVELEITAMIGEHDQVVLQWTSRGWTRDGRPYENGCIGVFTVRGGQIQSVREYMDTLYASSVFAAAPAR